MSLRRLFQLAAALAAVAAAAVVVVVAAAFGVYALARIWLIPAGAAAVTAALFAVLALALAWSATRKFPEAKDDATLVDRLIQMAKDRPLIAAGAAAAILTIVLRNPAVLSAILSAVLAGGAAKSDAK